ncbi:MAG TPA: bifunctional UDP-sugar hydrolase/5'-nucleotidase [Jiangellales bacterium]|nr:bifunctional UDP-sugar hydrolase/5'-nucleotidase [Jiangellales bacterium]
MRTTLTRGLAAALVAVSMTAGPASAESVVPPPDAWPTIPVQLLSFTDLHGYLAPTTGGDAVVYDANGQRITVGGAAFLATHLAQLRAGQTNSILFATGDSFTGYQPAQNAFRDEPTIEFMNTVGVQFSTVGNHELDISRDFLADHMGKGKCFGTVDVDSCFTDSTGRRFHGADFPFLTGNIVDGSTGRNILPATNVEWVRGSDGRAVPVGFINLTVPDTPYGTTSYQPSLKSLPVVATANRYAAELKQRGVQAIVMNLHDGGVAYGSGHDYNGCQQPSGPAFDVARNASPDIDAIVTGHWHTQFNCMVPDPAGNPRPVVEAGNAGKLISEINLQIDPRTGEVIRGASQSANHPNTRDVAPDPAVSRMVDYWTQRAAEAYARPVASITADITRTLNPAGESTLADLAADAFWEDANQTDAGKADLALVAARPKGQSVLNADLRYAAGTTAGDADGVVTFGEAYTSIGYDNPVLTLSLTGARLKQALESQWEVRPDGTTVFHPLAVSRNVHYTYDASRPLGQRVAAEDVVIGGSPLQLDRTYRVAVLAYTAMGSDGSSIADTVINADGLKQLDPSTAPYRNSRDREAIRGYLTRHGTVSPSALDRVAARTV